jgi:hypothetical protein
MNTNSLEEFFQFKQQPKDTPLKDEHRNPVLDIVGHQILCDGCWKSPYMDSYKASISDLHAAMVRLAAIVSLVPAAWPFPKKPSIKAVNIIEAVVAFVTVAILLNA